MGRSHRPKPTSLGKKLYQIRIGLDLTQEQMIKRLRYTKSPLYPSNISEYESSKREPPLLVLLAYARAAGISTDVLIDDAMDLPDKLPSTMERKEARRRRG